MKILLVGGGSGGHVTPIIAIAKKLRQDDPRNEITIWTDKKFFAQTCALAQNELPKSVKIVCIPSGKLRRYANLNFWYKYFSWYHLTHTHLPNLVDSFRLVGGFATSLARLRRLQPDVIFCKGGYVCLPVGLAAHLLNLPLVIHDSDTVPGLTNRVLAHFASAIGTGSPVENYPNYTRQITKFVGIPVRAEFTELDAAARRQTKKDLGLDPAKQLIFVAGGGGGAAIFSEIFREIAPKLIAKFNVQIFLLTGKGKGFAVEKPLANDFIVKDFITDEYPALLNACDIFVTRAGATSMAEAAVSETATIIVPSPYLAGDHQTKNAEIFAKADAAIALKQNKTEDNFDTKLADDLSRNIAQLLGVDGERRRAELGRNLAKFAKKDALDAIVKMIITTGRKREKLEKNYAQLATELADNHRHKKDQS